MSFNTQIDDLLDTLSSENSDEVERQLRVYDIIDDKIAVVAKRLLDVEEGGGGGGGSLPDPITTPLNVSPTDNTINSLETITAPSGFADNTSGDGALIEAVDTDSSKSVFIADVYGNITTNSPVNSTSLQQFSSGGQYWIGYADDSESKVEGTDAEGQVSWRVSSLAFGVFGATASPQQATPVTLQDVIALLQTFGFCE